MANIFLSVAIAFAAADDGQKIDPVVGQLQGTWELNLTTNGDSIRIVKEIEERTETVSAYRNGKLFQKHKVDFVIRDEGPVTVFRWTNGKHLAGARNGQPLTDGAAIFRIVDGQWISVEGMLKDDPPRFSVQRFRRPK